MDWLIETFPLLRDAAASVSDNPWVILAILLPAIALIFILQIVLGRFADDLYGFLRSRTLRLLGMERRPPEATPPAPGEPAADTDVIRTARASYQIAGPLAQGNLGMVYAGTDDRDNPVAVKVAAHTEDNDFFQTEARVLRLLHSHGERYSKHLPEFIEEFHTPDGRQGTVLGRLDGYDLYAVREKYPEGIPERHVIWLFRRVLSVIGFAHSKGILHGNFEPAHIMLRPGDHNVWLLDWSYAVYDPARTGQKFRVFNETYSAPEVAEKKPPLPSADLFSVGRCMIYVLGGDPLSGSMPPAVDERIQRFIRQFTIQSPMFRPQYAL